MAAPRQEEKQDMATRPRDPALACVVWDGSSFVASDTPFAGEELQFPVYSQTPVGPPVSAVEITRGTPSLFTISIRGRVDNVIELVQIRGHKFSNKIIRPYMLEMPVQPQHFHRQGFRFVETNGTLLDGFLNDFDSQLRKHTIGTESFIGVVGMKTLDVLSPVASSEKKKAVLVDGISIRHDLLAPTRVGKEYRIYTSTYRFPIPDPFIAIENYPLHSALVPCQFVREDVARQIVAEHPFFRPEDEGGEWREIGRLVLGEDGGMTVHSTDDKSWDPTHKDGWPRAIATIGYPKKIQKEAKLVINDAVMPLKLASSTVGDKLFDMIVELCPYMLSRVEVDDSDKWDEFVEEVRVSYTSEKLAARVNKVDYLLHTLCQDELFGSSVVSVAKEAGVISMSDRMLAEKLCRVSGYEELIESVWTQIAQETKR